MAHIYTQQLLSPTFCWWGLPYLQTKKALKNEGNI